jgi:putative lipoprotein
VPSVKTRSFRSTVACASWALLAGCGAAPEPDGPPAAGERVTDTPPIVARFDCDTFALTATFHDRRVTLDLPTRTLTIPQIEAASGARFADAQASFWNKGMEATFEIDGRTEHCVERRDPWQDARDRGVDFRAVGQEPGWFLEIDRETQIRLVYDYAEQQAVAASPAPVVSGHALAYEVMAGADRLRIVIEERACRDVMSGEAFPRTVTVTIGQRTLHGCGRDLADAS